MWYGMFLFLLGLLTGLLEKHCINMRMGVSAHLEGVMNGTFLIVLGAIWTEVRLSPPVKTAVFWIALYGHMPTFFTTLAATLVTAAANPISAAGHHGLFWQESMAGAGFLSVSIAIIVASLVVLWGLRAKASQLRTPAKANESIPVVDGGRR
jgi:hydroxylaminobenzene mutase